MKKLILVLILAVLSSTCFSKIIYPTVTRTIINERGRPESVTFEIFPDGTERRVDPSEYRNAIDPGENDVVSIRKFGEDGFQVELASGRKERYCITKDVRLYKDDVGLSTCVR